MRVWCSLDSKVQQGLEQQAAGHRHPAAIRRVHVFTVTVQPFTAPKKMATKKLYKIVFHNNGKVYELYARSVSSSDLWGFTCVSGLEFGTREGVLVDPTEERLREEFSGTKVLHLPMQSIVRIEEVATRGVAVIRDGVSGDKIVTLPLPPSRMG